MAEIFGIALSGGGGGSSKSTVYISGLTQTNTASVVATSGGKTVSGSYKDGYWVLKNLDYGTAASPVRWNITATSANGQQTATAQVSFSRQEIEYITMSYFAATIAVTYPAGAVCTCTKGDMVLAAPDTSGSHTFVVPEAGDWIVKAVQGDDSATETVSIASSGQTETVELSFALYIFKSGTGLKAGFTLYSWYTPDVSDNAVNFPGPNVRANIKPAIDLTQYKTCSVRYSLNINDAGNGPGRIGFQESDDYFNYGAYNNNFPASFKMSNGANNSNRTIDIESLNGEYYFAIHSFDVTKLEITEIVLTK